MTERMIGSVPKFRKATAGECVSVFREDIVGFCKLLAESGEIGDASAGRCIEVFSRPREEGDD